MAVTAAGRDLTRRFRTEQLGIRARMLRALLRLWPLLDVRRLDATAPEWLRLNVQTIAEHRRESAWAAAAYYERLRAAEAASVPPYRARWLDSQVDTVAHNAIRQSLIVTGPVAIKKASAKLTVITGTDPDAVAQRALDKIRATALTQVEGAASRHVLDGGREVLREEAARDPVALGFARRSDGDPCYFCALMISRGFVYRSETDAGRSANTKFVGDGLYKFHDHCACTLEPLFNRDTPLPADADKYDRIYRKATAGLSGERAIAAFRAAYDAQRP
jgi:hypothetical protein